MLWWHLFVLGSGILLNGYTLGNSVRTVSHPIRHSLPTQVLQPLFGSQATGKCTSVTGNICNGTSVLSDGIIPALCGTSNCPQSEWAGQLFTMRRNLSRDASIVLSFEVEPVNHDRVELVVFNCPEYAIYTPFVNIYIDTSFHPEHLGSLKTSQSLSGASCDHLIRFCVDFNGAVSVTAFDLEFPYQNNSNYVFLAEVTFLNGGAEPCDPPELITIPVTRFLSTTEEPTPGPIPTTVTTANESVSVVLSVDPESSCFFTALIAGGASALGSTILVLCISVIIHVTVYQCVYKPRQRSRAVLDGVYQKGVNNNSTVPAEHEYAVIYEVIGERVNTTDMELEMKHNEVYGLAEPNEN